MGPLNPNKGGGKHKKSAKKVQNAIGSLSSASTAAVNGLNGNNSHQSPLINSNQFAVGSTNAGTASVFSKNQDGLNSKASSNYYTVINQTLATQVAHSMKEGSFIHKELVSNVAAQYHHRREIMSGNASQNEQH